MNLFFFAAFAFCLSTLGLCAPIGRKLNKDEHLRPHRPSTQKNVSEASHLGRRIRSVVARRRTTSHAHNEVALKDSAVALIDENEADLTEFQSKDFDRLYSQLGYK